MNIFRTLLWIQGCYTLLTAIWPLVDIHSFMLATGYKTDIWLIKTVGALLIPVALTMLSFLFIDTDQRPVFILGSLTSAAFISIDFYYALNDVISDIYLGDGIIQIIFLITWLALAKPLLLKRSNK
ncbi:hypothetical protein [Chryseosolibacter indicus]|uniref:Uncharacterized protein n=1 Tax=Chryseosolibacter indicus TaxID=2782351 RepID=A0ABS5VLC4_9BACT|nr:hypothetical protein [Chryseosolibacter indicus]MBT1702250.1 hypothetical protein [Chryseosolibacter indicus]